VIIDELMAEEVAACVELSRRGKILITSIHALTGVDFVQSRFPVECDLKQFSEFCDVVVTTASYATNKQKRVYEVAQMVYDADGLPGLPVLYEHQGSDEDPFFKLVKRSGILSPAAR